MHPLRGYIVRDGGKMVGYGGAIPVSYSLDGQRIGALAATTLRVNEGHVQCGLGIMLRMRRLGEQVPFAHTTPVPKLRKVLHDMGAKVESHLVRRLVPIGTFSRLLPGGSGWPKLDPSMTVVTSVSDVTRLAEPALPRKGLEPFVSLESLCWQLTTPMHQLHFIGAVDITGTLYSCLILRRRERVMRAFTAWEVVQSWTARNSAEEVQALVGKLVRDPGLLGERLNWLSSTAFPEDRHWEGTPRLTEHQEEVCHYFLLPESCREVKKLSMLAEGDLLL
ncbi:hypothetical protein [Brevifollis gellanilyticus]|nr:hypothetical protein [Brevifollis gellanilyticus]